MITNIKLFKESLDNNRNEIIQDIILKNGEEVTAEELALYCYDNYDKITGRDLNDRDDEGHFPDEFDQLMDHFDIDEEDFQEEWNYYADSNSEPEEREMNADQEVLDRIRVELEKPEYEEAVYELAADLAIEDPDLRSQLYHDSVSDVIDYILDEWSHFGITWDEFMSTWLTYTGEEE